MYTECSARHDWMRCGRIYVVTDTLHVEVLAEVGDMQADGTYYLFIPGAWYYIFYPRAPFTWND